MLYVVESPEAQSVADNICDQITLSGFGFVIANILTMLYYTPSMDQDCPSWVYASWSIGLFLYQTFDAIDGSQAYVLSSALLLTGSVLKVAR